MVAAEVKTPFADNLESTLSDHETQAILEIFEKIGIRSWLTQNPFKQIKLVGRSYILGTEVHGWYDIRKKASPTRRVFCRDIRRVGTLSC